MRPLATLSARAVAVGVSPCVCVGHSAARLRTSPPAARPAAHDPLHLPRWARSPRLPPACRAQPARRELDLGLATHRARLPHPFERSVCKRQRPLERSPERDCAAERAGVPVRAPCAPRARARRRASRRGRVICALRRASACALSLPRSPPPPSCPPCHHPPPRATRHAPNWPPGPRTRPPSSRSFRPPRPSSSVPSRPTTVCRWRRRVGTAAHHAPRRLALFSAVNHNSLEGPLPTELSGMKALRLLCAHAPCAVPCAPPPSRPSRPHVAHEGHVRGGARRPQSGGRGAASSCREHENQPPRGAGSRAATATSRIGQPVHARPPRPRPRPDLPPHAARRSPRGVRSQVPRRQLAERLSEH